MRIVSCQRWSIFVFFFNDTATTEIYTLSLHDALPIWCPPCPASRSWDGSSSVDGTDGLVRTPGRARHGSGGGEEADRKSTRLNSSHANISYAVFCLKKKKKDIYILPHVNRTTLDTHI